MDPCMHPGVVGPARRCHAWPMRSLSGSACGCHSAHARSCSRPCMLTALHLHMWLGTAHAPLSGMGAGMWTALPSSSILRSVTCAHAGRGRGRVRGRAGRTDPIGRTWQRAFTLPCLGGRHLRHMGPMQPGAPSVWHMALAQALGHARGSAGSRCPATPGRRRSW